LDQLVPTFEGQFAEAQGARDAQWQSKQAELQASMDQATAGLTSQAQQTEQGLKDAAAEVLAEVRSRRDEVEKLYRVIADTGTAGGFAKEANEQRKVADLWRLIALGLGILTIALAVGAVLFSAYTDKATNTSHIIVVLVAAAAGGLTGYAAKQSGHHRDREDEAKRLELELTAFGPFTDALADPDVARAAYAERLFRGGDGGRREDAAITKDQVSLFQSIVEMLISSRK
jgi:flagellar basal body-associated protein FliL